MAIILPDAETVRTISSNASKALSQRMVKDERTGKSKPIICAICDSMVTISNPCVLVPLNKLVKRLHRARAHRHRIIGAYENKKVVDSYVAEHPALAQFVLSPATHVQKMRNGSECVCLCRSCKTEMEEKVNKRNKYISPCRALWNYNLVGELPDCLKDLYPPEVALICPNQIITHAILLRSDHHQGIYGWHSMFENRVDMNIGNIQYLIDSGMTGEIICVFCGPFDSTQYDKAKQQYSIRPQKVIEAFNWLKANNHFFRDIIVPEASKIPPVRYQWTDDFRVETAANQQNISNEINVTVLFPEENENVASNGTFKSQEEFRKFLFDHPNQRVDHVFHSRPEPNRKKDYMQDEFIRAFPLQFPFGYAGFTKQSGMGNALIKREVPLGENELLKHFLRHRRLEFHHSDFNLIAGSLTMRQKIFLNTRIQCNLRAQDARQMGEQFGSLTGDELNDSVSEARHRGYVNGQYSKGEQFLKSINAVAAELPHTNEAAKRAKEDYFSMLIKHGLPALMVTINPDDQRSLWIKVYLLKEPEKFWSTEPDLRNLDANDIIAEYRQRCTDRVKYPGLCAEEFIAVRDVFIRDILRWDLENEERTGTGLFGLTEAVALSCEEQGRKTLHGHFLIWIKGWNELLHRIMERADSNTEVRRPHGVEKDRQELKRFVEHCSSAMMFQDFESNEVLGETKIFAHGNESCRNERQSSQSRFTVLPVTDEQFAEMRNNEKCHVHRGHIATCPKCRSPLHLHNIMDTAIQGITGDTRYTFTKGTPGKRRLERHVYEFQKDTDWPNQGPAKRAKRLFMTNALINSHDVMHSPRCFKKSPTCYVNLPATPVEKTHIQFATEPSFWASWNGETMKKWIFGVNLKRRLQDAFTNVHNRILTLLFLCNNNVMVAMTGAAVFYMTCYAVKKTQKDERQAFEAVATVLLKVIEKQMENEDTTNSLSLSQIGFRRLLLAIYVHTSSLVIAGPMAHYIATTGSRYLFSHTLEYFPIRTLSKLLKGEEICMQFANTGSDRRVPFSSAMHYIYRPKEYEDMCPYHFWSWIKIMTPKQAEKAGLEHFHFADGHIKQGRVVAAHRLKSVIPKMDWTFFSDAKKLSTPINLQQHPNRLGQVSQKEEDYCRAILIAFTSFRKEEDLLYRGSYMKRLVYEYQCGRLEPYIQYIQNIQNIRDSLDAGSLNKNGFPEEIDPDAPFDPEEANNADLQSRIAAFFEDTSDSPKLFEEPTIFTTPKNTTHVPDCSTASPNPNAMQNVIVESIDTAATQNSTKPSRTRTIPATYKLNFLIQTAFEIDHGENNDVVIKATGTAKSIIAYGYSKRLDLDQQTGFEILCAEVVLSFLVDTIKQASEEGKTEEVERFEKEAKLLKQLAQIEERKGKPLRLFLTGPAGAGKSSILNCLISYCQEFCRSIGCVFDATTIRLTAMTGAAATEIKGDTVHRVCKISQKVTEDDKEEWLNTRLLVVDEISFAGYEELLIELSKNLQNLTNSRDYLFGSVAIVFIGDFFQLDPSFGTAIYKYPNSLYWEHELNRMVELKGEWRFKECDKLRLAFRTYRQNGLTPEIREVFNSRLIGKKNPDGTSVEMPPLQTTKIATHKNETKEAYNEKVFVKHLETYHSMDENAPIPQFTVIIKGGLKWTHQNRPLNYTQRNRFFHNSNLSNTKTTCKKKKGISCLLKLFYNCETMVTDNLDVQHGVANGTQALFQSLKLKAGKTAHKICYNGYWVYSVHADDIEFVRLKWSEGSMFQGTFTLAPKTAACKTIVKVNEFGRREELEMYVSIRQLMLVSNQSTTGHKLQGKTVDRLVIGEWATGVKNWIYVVLSRVRTLSGLFLLSPIPENAIVRPDSQMLEMMARLRSRLLHKNQDDDTIRNLRESTYAELDPHLPPLD